MFRSVYSQRNKAFIIKPDQIIKFEYLHLLTVNLSKVNDYYYY